MWILLFPLFALSKEYTSKETACYILATEYFTKQSKTIQNEIDRDKNLDPLGIINKMVMDSFARCNNTITEEQATKVLKYTVTDEYISLVEIDINSYKTISVEPNFDFIKEFKRIQVSVPRHRDEL